MYAVKTLGPDDREEIKALFAGVFTKEPWCDDWSDAEQLDLYIRDLTGHSGQLAYGLYDGADELIGISLGRIRHWYTGTEYFIDEFCVRTDRQGAGAGTFFIREIEKAAAELGVKRIFLLTDPGVPAYEFYRKNGFAESKSTAALSKQVRG